MTVEDLARIAGMSESHLAALIRKQVGAPVLRYQTSVRMAQARLLLDTTDQPVAAIASEVGYSDPFYFRRHFKSIHGVTPLVYRRHLKRGEEPVNRAATRWAMPRWRARDVDRAR